jgi:cell wall-associated NlpC family hydrolase
VSLARAVARIFLPVALVLGVVLANVAPAAAESAPTSEFQQVFDLAKSKIGDHWRHYAKGPSKFDCVGFVWYIFNQNNLQSHIGGYRGVKAYYQWFQQRGDVSRDNPQPGDLIIWGKFQHMGMYIGNGMAISALVNPWGVKIHPVMTWIDEPFRYYLHTHLQS